MHRCNQLAPPSDVDDLISASHHDGAKTGRRVDRDERAAVGGVRSLWLLSLLMLNPVAPSSRAGSSLQVERYSCSWELGDLSVIV